jgi:hypothetical protein
MNDEPDYWIKNNLVKPDPWVVCAANRNKESGRIICAPRHWDNTMRAQKLECEDWGGWDQGFVNQFGEFLTREEAWKIAKKNNQIKRFTIEGTLFSEDLY